MGTTEPNRVKAQPLKKKKKRLFHLCEMIFLWFDSWIPSNLWKPCNSGQPKGHRTLIWQELRNKPNEVQPSLTSFQCWMQCETQNCGSNIYRCAIIHELPNGFQMRSEWSTALVLGDQEWTWAKGEDMSRFSREKLGNHLRLATMTKTSSRLKFL